MRSRMLSFFWFEGSLRWCFFFTWCDRKCGIGCDELVAAAHRLVAAVDWDGNQGDPAGQGSACGGRGDAAEAVEQELHGCALWRVAIFDDGPVLHGHAGDESWKRLCGVGQGRVDSLQEAREGT